MSRAKRGRGEGGVFQRESDGLWVGTVSLGFDGNGKRRRRVVYAKTKKDVMDKLRALQSKAPGSTLPNSKGLTVSGFLDEWLAATKSSLAPGTHATYEQHVRNLLKPVLGGVRLDALKPRHVQGMYAQLAADGYSAAMQRKAGVTFRAALSWAVRVAEYVTDNPVKRVKMPAHRPPEVRSLAPEELSAFLAAARSDRLYAMYVLAVDSGCRQGELLALNWSDIDLARGTVSVTKSLEEVGGRLRVKEPKRERGRRLIHVSPFAVEAMGLHQARMIDEECYRPDGVVFCGQRNRSWLRKSDIYRHSFKLILKAAGLTFKFHVLRHSCASLLIEAGADVKTVQDRLGHSTAAMTMDTYAHVMNRARATAATKLDAILTAASTQQKPVTT